MHFLIWYIIKCVRKKYSTVHHIHSYSHIWALLLLSFSGSVRSGRGAYPPYRFYRPYPCFQLWTEGHMQTANWTAPGANKKKSERERDERSYHWIHLPTAEHVTQEQAHKVPSLLCLNLYLCKNHPLHSTKIPYIKYGLSRRSPAVL